MSGRLLGIVLLVLGIIGGCVPRSEPVRPAGPDAAAPTPVVVPRAPAPPRVGTAAADFALAGLTGNTVALSDLRGRAVLVNFWASWCGPCRAELPQLIRFYGERGGPTFELLAVNVREDADRARRFAEANQVNFPVLLDPEGKAATAYHVRGLPTSVFVDAQGTIRAIHVGVLTENLLREYMAALETSAPR